MKRIFNEKIQKAGLLIGCAALLLSACGNKNDEMEAKIRADFFDEETEIGALLAKYTEVDVKEVKKDVVTVAVKAPDVTEALWTWFEENEFTEERFDAALEQAMKESGETEEFKLTVGEDGEIEYSEEFRASLSAGLPEFYYMVYQYAVEELKEEADEAE